MDFHLVIHTPLPLPFNTFAVMVLTAWNALPLKVRLYETIHIRKRHLKNDLFIQ